MIELRKVCTMAHYTHWEVHGDAEGTISTQTPIDSKAPRALWVTGAEGIVSLTPKRKIVAYRKLLDALADMARIWGLSEIRIEGNRLAKWGAVLTDFVLINDRGVAVLRRLL